MKVLLGDTWEWVDEIRADWLDLLARDSRASPFMDPDFGRLWMSCRPGTGREKPLVAAGYEGGELRTLAPMCVATRGRSIASLRRLRFMVSAPYLDSGFLPSDAAGPQLEAMLSEAFEQSRCEMMDLFSIPRDSASLLPLDKLIRQLGLGFEALCSPSWGKTFGLIHGDWDAYFAARSAKTRHNLRKAAKAVESLGRHEIRRFRNPQDLGPLMDDLNFVVRNSWKGSGDFAAGAFWGQFLELMGRKGWLDAHLLYLRDLPAAFLILLRYRDAVYFMQTAYDRRFSKASLGTYLMSQVLEGLFREPEGAKRYDYLTSYPYLRSLSDLYEPRVKLRGYPRGPKGRAVALGFRAMGARRRGQGVLRFGSVGELLDAGFPGESAPGQ